MSRACWVGADPAVQATAATTRALEQVTEAPWALVSSSAKQDTNRTYLCVVVCSSEVSCDTHPELSVSVVLCGGLCDSCTDEEREVQNG